MGGEQVRKYYALETSGREADICIFGDITSWEWLESDVSSYTLSKELQELDVDTINVHINSYGGEVAEGLAIYNTLKNHKATVRTYCDGFACSIASVIFMAGDERIMNEASLLMIHNAWMYTAGDAEQLRKDADDLDKITQASVAAYMSRVNITEDELKALLDAETWLLPSEALEKGFATSIVAEPQTNKAAASARKALFSLVKKPKEGLTVDVRVTDIPEFQEMMADIKAEIDALKPPEPEADMPENKTLKFFNALLGGKE
jgi:ATP-dependent Clp protease protease subunit